MTEKTAKECPFCGWKNIRVMEAKKKTNPLKGSNYTYCWCRVCGTRGPWAYSVDDDLKIVSDKCIDRWNERNGVKHEN